MNDKLQKAFNKLESSRIELLNELKKYPDELLNKKPSAEAWSVIDTMNHLMTAEGFSLKYLQKKTQQLNTVKHAGLREAYKSLLLKVVFMLPFKFKVPPVIDTPHKVVSLKDMEAGWTAIRKGLMDITAPLQEADLKRALWKHAIAGNMNIYQMVGFLQIHFNRHKAQIYRTIAAVSKV